MARIKGFKQVIDNISDFDKRTVKRLVIAVQATQALVSNDAKQIVPVVTSTLLKSIFSPPDPVLITKRSITAQVSANVEYASFVEFGTSRSRPKPYLGPALLKNQSTFKRLVQKAITL